MNYVEYYKGFIGILKIKKNSAVIVVESPYRNELLNRRYLYPVIFTPYDDVEICSTTNKYRKICDELFDGSKESIAKIFMMIKRDDTVHKLSNMHRYSIDYSRDLIETKAINLTEKIVRDMSFSITIEPEEYIRRKKEIIKEKRQYVIIENGCIASTAFISDIYNSGANIVVFTVPEYRSKGYGKEVVNACVNWCKENELLPIYLVEENNITSIKLAESIGFQLKNVETVITEMFL